MPVVRFSSVVVQEWRINPNQHEACQKYQRNAYYVDCHVHIVMVIGAVLYIMAETCVRTSYIERIDCSNIRSGAVLLDPVKSSFAVMCSLYGDESRVSWVA